MGSEVLVKIRVKVSEKMTLGIARMKCYSRWGINLETSNTFLLVAFIGAVMSH